MSHPPDSLVIVGAGVSGCALAAQLRHLGWRGPIRMVEAGRGVGGRAASRPDRRDPAWRLDHGAPFLDLQGAEPPALLRPLLQGGWIRPWPAAAADAGGSGGALMQLEADGSLSDQPGPMASAGRLYRGWPAMADLAAGMLELAEQACQSDAAAAGAPAVERLHGRRVESLERRDGLWHLGDAEGTTLAVAGWLVLSGTLLAHPRCRELLGCTEVPLAAVNRQLEDPALTHALTAIADLRYDPRLALLLRLEADQGAPWRALPFRHLWLSEAARQHWGLERISLQPLSDGRCGVVAHARPDDLIRFGQLAATAAGGSSGSAATPDPDGPIAALSHALLNALSPWISRADLPASPGRQLMRWGGAFPLAPGLDGEAMVCPSSRVALCGDAINGPGFGRIEGAWRSGEWLAGRLLPLLEGRCS